MMKEPDPIYYESEQEYYEAMNAYEEHLINEEWSRSGANKAILGWLLVIVTFGLILLGIYLYI